MAGFSAAFLLACGIFFLLVPGGIETTRLARSLVAAGLTPQQVATGMGVFSLGLAAYVWPLWRKLAHALPPLRWAPMDSLSELATLFQSRQAGRLSRRLMLSGSRGSRY